MMELLRWKTRIALLWVILTVNFSAFIFLGLFNPGGMKELLETQVDARTRSGVAVLFFIPFIMAWLSMTLRDPANRWMNVVMGILFALLFVSQIFQYAAAGTPATTLIDLLFALAVTILIIWYAWKWPKREA
jgi:hypothetical protein